MYSICLLYTSDAADEEDSVDLGALLPGNDSYGRPASSLFS